MLEAHHRRGDRDAALALDRHPIRAHPPPRAARLHFARQLDRPANSKSFSVRVVLPASGCEMIANVRRRKISSVRVLINRLYLLSRDGSRHAGPRMPSAEWYMMAELPFQRTSGFMTLWRPKLPHV